ncbi:MAG: hypothetical protein F6K21_18570, partial [Symploca sp. SIO2D2]|nr:hypothetical protein [Symploca sp. SIO2D2]
MARKRSLFYGAIQSFLRGRGQRAEGRRQEAEPTPRACFQSQKPDVGAKHLGDNLSVKPKLYNPNASPSDSLNTRLSPSKEGKRRQNPPLTPPRRGTGGRRQEVREEVGGSASSLHRGWYVACWVLLKVTRRGIILFLLGIFLTVGILPVFSKTSVASPISREQLEKIQTLQQSGRYYQACVNLVQALEFDREICQNQDLSEEFDSIAKKIAQQPNPVQIMGIFGNILRGIGRLRLAEEFLERGLDIAQSPQSEAKLSLSLGNTFRALGNRERDRQAASIDDYLPWRCMNLSQVEEIPPTATGLYQQASAR